jgi:mRNA-degrading endonuclease RelE of RelBE toxin-antitoxin system
VQYRVTWRNAATKHFLALDKPVRQQVDALIAKLAEDPRHADVDVKSLVGMPGALRARGNYGGH